MPSLRIFFFGQGQTYQAPTVSGHKIDRFWGGFVSGNTQIRLTSYFVVVNQDDHLALAQVSDNFLNWCDR
jgi:hypothetical protein